MNVAGKIVVVVPPDRPHVPACGLTTAVTPPTTTLLVASIFAVPVISPVAGVVDCGYPLTNGKVVLTVKLVGICDST